MSRPGAPPALPVADSLLFKLVRAVNLTARPFTDSIGRKHGLGLNAWRVLIVIAGRPGVAASEVALLAGLDKMGVSRAVAELLRDERLVRRVDVSDKRRMHLFLSPTGRRLFSQIGPPAKERERQLFAGISATKQRQLEATLDQMILNILTVDEQVAP